MPEQTQELNVDINQKYGTTSCLMPPNMLGNHSDAETERSSRKPFEIKMRYKRQTLQDMTRPLKTWLYKNRDNPYPTKAEKMSLAADSNMTLTQVSNWFANARRRLKNTVSNPDLSWGKRVKMYNSCVKGNQELLSISSEDSAWESGEDGETKPAQEMRSDSLHARLSASPHEPLGCYPGATTTTDPLSPSMLPLNLSRSATTLPPPPPHPLSQPHPTTTERTPETAHKIVTEMLQQHLYQQQAQREETRRDLRDSREVGVSQEEEMEQEEEQERLVEQRRCAPDCGNHDALMISDVDQPPKFKNSILQRYLQDSYKHNITLGGMRGTQGHGNHHHHSSGANSTGSFMKHNNNGGGGGNNNTATNTPRHRNPSGSLSSHDYEDLSVSSRSTPTRDMLSAGSGGTGVGVVPGTSASAWGISGAAAGHGDGAGRVHGGAATAGDIHRMVGEEELWRQWPQIENKANEDMHWKEISAALALTALSRGDFSRNHNNL